MQIKDSKINKFIDVCLLLMCNFDVIFKNLMIMMKRILCVSFLTIVSLVGFSQNAKITGNVSDKDTKTPVSKATVEVLQNDVITNQGISDEKGNFEIGKVPMGKTKVIVKATGYETYSSEITLDKKEINLGSISMKASNGGIDNSGVSEVNISSMDFEDEGKGQNVSGLLHSSGDAFTSVASYTFSSAYFRVRGYDSENALVYMNNTFMNDPENGRASWSEWGGLNDAMRNKEVINGLSSAGFAFGGLGGETNINTRASNFRKQSKFSYALSNKSYRQRLMYTYSTGLMDNGWAFAASASRRWANEGYVEGTFYDSYSYFASAEKKINEKSSLGLTVFGAPTRKGMQGASAQEVYDMMGTNYYNPNWGLQDGEKRNSRIKNINQPTFLLSYNLDISDKIKLSNNIAYSFGKDSYSALNWYDAPDPRPDYYRNLPSWQENSDYFNPADPAIVNAITEAWQTNQNVSQLNWDNLYQVNYLSNLDGKQAKYIIEDRRNDQSILTYNALLTYLKSDHTTITGGLELRKSVGYHYKKILDLLGGNYWLDIDQFSEQDFPENPDMMQNDINNPNREVKVGDRYGYDYNINVNSGKIWGQANWTYNKLDFFAALNVSQTSFWRTGNMRNGRAPDNSYGESEKSNFTNFGIKGGVTYKINGKNYIDANATYSTVAPFARNSFISPAIKATVLPGLKSSTVYGGDISYIVKTQVVSARFTAYESFFNDMTELTSFYHDTYRTFVNMTLSGIDKIHQGFEIGTEVKASSTISIIGVAAIGNNRYTSRPTATVSVENGSKADTTQLVYQKYFYVPGPQNAFSLGIKYNHPKQWFFTANVNFYDKMYLDFNPLRRSQSAIPLMGEGDPKIIVITQQEKLPNGFTLDASLGKSLRYKQLNFNFNFSVNNILNNTELITGGYEQMRFDYVNQDLAKFPPKYFYGFGRTFYFNLIVRI